MLLENTKKILIRKTQLLKNTIASLKKKKLLN